MKKSLIGLLLAAMMAVQSFTPVLAADNVQPSAEEQVQLQNLNSAPGGEITENTTALTGGIWTVNGTPKVNGVRLNNKQITVSGVNEIKAGVVPAGLKGNFLDLQNCVITIQPGAELIFKDGLTYSISVSGEPSIINHGTLILEASYMNFESQEEANSGFAIRNEKDGILIVRDVANIGCKNAIFAENSGEIRMEGGKVYSGQRGLNAQTGTTVIRQLDGSLTLTGGLLVNVPSETEDYPIIDLQGGTLSVDGGKIMQKKGLYPSTTAAIHVADPKLAGGVSIADGGIEIESGINPYVSGMPSHAVTIHALHATVDGLPETASLFNPICMKISPDAGYAVKEVSYTVGGGEKQILTEKNGNYTIPGSKINGNLDVTVTVAESYTVRFDSNGGMGTMSDETNLTAGEYTLPVCDFGAPTDSRFIGWQVNGDSSKTYQPNEKIVLTGNTVLKAMWEKIDYVNVTVKAGSGKGEDQTHRVEKNTEFTFPRCTFTAPAGGEGTEMGFAGWEAGGKIYQSGDKLQITGDLVITATWKDMKVIQVQANQTRWENGSKMKLMDNVDMGHDVDVFGAVELELGEGKTLKLTGLYLSPNAKLTISGTGTLIAESTNEDIILLNDGAKLQIDGGTVTVTTTLQYTDYKPRAIYNDFESDFTTVGAIEMNGGSLTVNGDLYVGLGTLTVNGGTLNANSGIQVKKSKDGKRTGTLTVNGGVVTAWSDGMGAAIGSFDGRDQGELPQFCSACGNIIINGGKVWAEVVKNSYSDQPAAIGSGARVGGGNIVITGGDVTAIAESPADGIGSASHATNKAAFSTGENGNAVIRTAKITDNTDPKTWSGIIGLQNFLTVYGYQTLKQDLTVGEQEFLYVPANAALTVPAGIHLVNNGVIKNLGGIQGVIEGKQPEVAVEVKFTFDANGGNGTMKPQSSAVGLPFTLPKCSFTAPAGCEFFKWQIGDKFYAPGDVITVERSETVLAVWSAIELHLEALPDVSTLPYEASKAFDGNLETTWTKYGAPAYLRFKAEEPVTVSRLVIEKNNSNDMLPSIYSLQVLKNEEEFLQITDQAEQNNYLKNENNWMPILKVDNITGKEASVSTHVNFDQLRQYYSLYCEEPRGSLFQIAELRLYPLNNPCDIIFTPGDAVGAAEKYRVEQGEAFMLPACTYTKPAHRFIGWKSDDGRIGNPGELFMIKGNTTLTAQWEKLPSYTMTFKANGSEGRMEPVEWVQGKETPLPDCTFTKSGYVFAGWQIGEKLYQAGELYAPQADTELTAMWGKVIHEGPISGPITVEGCSGSTNSEEGPENLFDGSYANGQTKWCNNVNQGNNQWVAFSLKEPTTLTKMTVIHANGADENNVPNTKDFELQVMIDSAAYEAASDRDAYLADDANWENIAVVRGNTKGVTETTIEANGNEKYYRFHITDSGDSGEWGASRVYELILEDKAIRTDKIAGHSMTLTDEIKLNFTADLGATPSENTYMLFTVENPKVEPIKVLLSDAKKAGETLYTFSCPMVAKEMTDTIRAELYTDGSLMLTNRHSVKGYADILLNDTTGSYDNAKPFVRAMLNYGTAAQMYFDYRTDSLANAGLTEEQKQVPSATFDSYTFKPITTENTLAGITYAFSALDLNSTLGIKHYFTLNGDVAAADYQVSLISGDGIASAAKLSEPERGKLCIEIQDIYPQNLDKTYKLQVSHSSGTITVEYGPYTYARMVKNLPEGQMTALKNLMDAMDAYRVAAQQYIA